MELMSHRTRVIRSFLLTLLTAAVGLLNACTSVREESAKWDSTAAASTAAPIVREEFMVPGADPGISLYVRNKRLASMNSFTQDNVVLFVHGATYPAETGFDLQLDGISAMPGPPPLSRPTRWAPKPVPDSFVRPTGLWKTAAITGTRASLFTTRG